MGIDLGALGDLVIELGVDIAPLQSDLDQGASIAQQGADKISDAIGSATTGTDQLQQGLDDVVTSLNSAGAAATSFGSDASSATTGAQDLDTQAAALSTQMGDVQTNTDKATESISALTPATHESSSAMHEGAEAGDEIKDTLFELAAEVGIATGAFEILKESLESFSKAQDIQTSFTVLSGSAETAERSFEGLKTTAINLAIPFSDLLNIAQRLAPQFGVGTAALQSTLTAAADAAAGTGRSIDSVAASLDRVAISGQVATRQLAQIGISIGDIAEATGRTIDEETARLKKGGQDALADVDDISKGIEAKMGGAAESIASNLSGQFINLKNQLDFVAEDIGKALEPAASALLSAFSLVLPVVDELVSSVGSIYGGAVKENIDALVELFGSLKGAASDLKTAMDGIASSLAAILPPSLVADLKSLGDAVSASTTGFKVWVPGLSDATTALNALAAGVELVTGKIPAMDKAASDMAAKLQSGVNESLHDSAVKLGAFGDATKTATDNTAALQAALVAAQKDVKKYSELQQEGFDVTDKLADAQQKVVDIQAKLNPSLKLIIDEAAKYIDKGTQVVSVVGDMNDVNAQQVTQWTDTRTALDNVTDSTELAAAQVKFFNQDLEGLLGWSNELPTSLDKQTTSVQKLAGAMGKDFIKSLADAEAGQKALDDEYKNAGVPNADALSSALAKNQQAYQDLKDKGLVTTYGEMVHDQTVLQDEINIQTNLGNNTDDLKLKYSHLQDQLTTVKTGFTDTAKAITDAIGTDTQKAVDDLITGVGNLGDDFKKMGEDVVDIFVNRIIKDAMKPLLDALDSVIDKALQAAEDVLGIGSGKGGVLGTGVGVPAKVPGTGSGEGIPGVNGQPGVDTGAGGDAGGAGSAGSAASSGLTGIISAVSGVVTAITGIIGIFQSAHQENTLKDIESHTKVIAIATLGISDVSEKNQQGNETMFYFTKNTSDNSNILVNGALEQHPDAVLIQTAIGALYGLEHDWIYPRLVDIVANTAALTSQPSASLTADLSGAAKESLVSRSISPDTPVVNAQVDNTPIVAAITELQSQLIPMIGKIADSVIQLPSLLEEQISSFRQSTGAPPVPSIDSGTIPDITKTVAALQGPLEDIASNSDKQVSELTNILAALSQINNDVVSVGARIMPATPETILPNGNIQENSGSIVNALLGLQQTLFSPIKVIADISTQIPSLLISGFSSIAAAAIPVAVQNQSGFSDLLASMDALQQPLTDLNKTASKELDIMNVDQTQALAFQGALNSQLAQITLGIQGTTSMVQALSLNESQLIDIVTPWGDVFGGMSQALTDMLAFSQGQVYPRLSDILVALAQLNETSRQIVISVMLDGQQILSAMTSILEQQGVKSPAY